MRDYEDNQVDDLTIYLSEQDVSGFLTMELALESVKLAFKLKSQGSASNTPPMRMKFPQGGFSSSACSIPALGVMGLKSNSNKSKCFVHISSSVTGNLLAIIEGRQLEEYVTGAATGTATNSMANPQSHAMGIIGIGTVALKQAEAISTIRNIDTITVYDNDLTANKIFATKIGRCLGISTSPIADIEDCVKISDIIIVTNHIQPIIQGEWLRPGTHVNSVSNENFLNRAIDSDTVRRASVIAVQDIEQARYGSGDLIYPVQEGITDWPKVSRISDIVLGKSKGRIAPSDITIFESLSMAIEEIILGLRLYELAKTNRVGMPIGFSSN